MVLLRALVHAAEAIGVDRRALCARVGISAVDLESDGSIPTMQLAQAWLAASEMSNDPLFGLHAGQHAELGSYDVLDYLFFTSATLGDACRAVARFHPIISEIWRVDFVVEPPLARFCHWVPGEYVEPLHHAWDYFFSGSQKRLRAVLPGHVQPRAVHLMHRQRGHASEYERVFGCPVVFEHPVGEFVFDADYLGLRLLSSNAALHRLVRRHAEELLARVPSDHDLLPRARALLPELLPDKRLSLAFLARRLGTGERTLQRQLAEHGITYKQLVDQTRQEHALRGLDAGALSIQELSHALGFGSTAAFSRAFQRWRGMSPSEYQRRARGTLRSTN